MRRAPELITAGLYVIVLLNIVAVGGYWYEDDPVDREKKKDIILNEIVPELLKKFDQFLKDNGGFWSSGKFSWGDLNFIGVPDYLKRMLGFSMFDKNEKLRKLKEKIIAIPKIKEWLAKRPKTDL